MTDPSDAVAERAWRNLGTVFHERNDRRREVTEALGMSFFRIKALRRIAAAPAPLTPATSPSGCSPTAPTPPSWWTTWSAAAWWSGPQPGRPARQARDGDRGRARRGGGGRADPRHPAAEL